MAQAKTIGISVESYEWLKSQKVVPREGFDDVLKRLKKEKELTVHE